jgi:hypothetical protein
VTETEERKFQVLRWALVALNDYLDRRANGTLGDMDIETMIIEYGRTVDITPEEAHDAIEESLIAAFRL